MEFEDVRIIHLRNEERKKRYCNLSTGMYIKEQLVCFERYHIEKMRFSLVLPSGFSMLSQDQLHRKYPSLDRPDIVIGNEVGDVVFAFSTLQDHIADEKLRIETVGVLRTLIKSANPSIDFSDEGSVKNDIVSCSWLDFKSYVITGMIYNFTSIISFKSRTVLAMFSCSYDLKSWWLPVYLKIIETFDEQTGGKR